MKKSWLLPSANILCLIHCLGMGLISFTAPVALSHLHLEWIEYGVVFFNLVVGTFIFRNLKVSSKVFIALYVLIGSSFLSLLLHQHNLYHTSLIFTALFQIYVLFKSHQKKKHHCCDHNH
jgi:hypothetical protein